MLGNRHPFFAPLWRRIATVAATAGWAGLERYWGNTTWSLIFGALALYCFIEFFILFKPEDYANNEDPDA